MLTGEGGALPRDAFIQALKAEGVPCSAVYYEQYHDGLLDEAIASRGFQRLFSAERLKNYRASFQDLSGNQQVCSTTVCLFQNLLLTSPSELDQVVEAIGKIQTHSEQLVAKLS
jgi:perosamine synthetase